jgi:Cysteine rich repeat
VIAMKLRAVLKSALVCGALTLLCSPAMAQNAQQACAGDIKTYCSGVQKGEGRVAQCLRSHKDQVSPGCQRGMAQATTLMKEVVQACEDDVHRYCAGAAPGTTKQCLRTNFRQLSLGCKRELFEAKKGM